MTLPKSKPATIDDYIAAFPADIQAVLQTIRATVREAISYNMPTFRLERVLVHFGPFKTHIALFPPVRDQELKREAHRYQGEKGNLQFPLNEPIPYALIRRIVLARVQDIGSARPSKIL